MKKWLAVFIVLLAAGAYFLWPKASTEKPVVVSAQMDEENKTISISYITTKKDPTYLLAATVDGKKFYPAGASGGITTKRVVDQNGYQLREDVINLTAEEVSYFDEFTGGALLAAVSYEEYEPIQTILIVLKENEAAKGRIEQDSLRYTFTAPEPMEIATIGHYDSAATLGYLQNGREPQFPIELK